MQVLTCDTLGPVPGSHANMCGCQLCVDRAGASVQEVHCGLLEARGAHVRARRKIRDVQL